MAVSDPGDPFLFCVLNTDTNVLHPLLYYYYYYYLSLVSKAGKKGVFVLVWFVGVFLRFETEMEI